MSDFKEGDIVELIEEEDGIQSSTTLRIERDAKHNLSSVLCSKADGGMMMIYGLSPFNVWRFYKDNLRKIENATTKRYKVVSPITAETVAAEAPNCGEFNNLFGAAIQRIGPHPHESAILQWAEQNKRALDWLIKKGFIAEEKPELVAGMKAIGNEGTEYLIVNKYGTLGLLRLYDMQVLRGEIGPGVKISDDQPFLKYLKK